MPLTGLSSVISKPTDADLDTYDFFIQFLVENMVPIILPEDRFIMPYLLQGAMTDESPGVEAWKEHTTAFDRVQSVASTVSKPRPVSCIAEEAHVAENTARDHLERLVALNVLLKIERDDGAFYSPDPLHTRLQTLRDLLEEHDREGLIQLKIELQSKIEDWETDYNADSPDELRTRAAETETASQTRDLKKTASDWELALYRLSALEDAIENYATYTTDFRTSA
jgi:hypothetical protein